MKQKILTDIINRYPLFIPRIYVFIRSLILPVAEIEACLPSQGKILDIGCGYGFTTIYFALTSTIRQVTGIELIKKRVDIALKSAVNISNVNFAVEDLASKQNHHYDAIVAIDLLHHLTQSQKSQLLKQCHQLLSPSGTLVIKDINTRPLLKYLWNYLHDFIMTGNPLEFISSDNLTKLLDQNGFIVTQNKSLKSLLYPHQLYVCHKQ